MSTPSDSAPTARCVGEVSAGSLLDLHAVVAKTDVVQIGPNSSYRVTLSGEDGAELDLIFLGQTVVHGFTPGTKCAVTGRAAEREGRLVVWNPRYQLLASGHDTTGDASRATGCTPADDPNSEPATRTASDGALAFNSTDERTDNVPTSDAHTAEAAHGADAEHIEDAEHSVVAPAGRFRIYLGPAAGVGKTYAMLDEAHRRLERGRDVVIAVVDTHDRPATAAKLAGLEVIAPKTVHYRGAVFEEMDLEAVLARRPDIALVDELAHTNVPGSGRNEKRWQDVRELLAANISVISTLNAQHIESLAEVVERITGVAVRERVPDALPREADQIELVDSSPEQLRRRMLHGNIYPPESARQALNGFFRTDTLAALRELALRFVADDIDDKLIDRLTANSPARLEVTERVLVAVAAADGAGTVLRRAARLAARLKADLYAVHVRTQDPDPRNASDIAGLRTLAEDLSAQWHQVDGDPAGALMDFAVQHQITQIVLGRSRRSRWQRLTGGGSTVRRMTHRAMIAGIDLHIVARDQSGPVPSEPVAC